MSAKPKSSKGNEPSDSLLDANKDTELEKKVDALMSIEDTKPEKPAEVPEEPVAISIPVTHASDDEKSGAPLLPTDKLPSYGKKKTAKPVPQEEALPDELEPIEPPIEEVALGDSEEVVPQAEPVPVVAAQPEPQGNDELGLEDPSTSRAVDEIIAAEADELLTARDQSSVESHADEKPEKTKKKSSGRAKKIIIRLLIFIILAGSAVVMALPGTRYAILSTFGVRVSSSISVLDETTGQPLKNAEFSIAGSSAKTDTEGNASLSNLKLGKTTMTIKKPAFAEYNQPVTLGWGSNPLGQFKVKAVGSQYKFAVTDFLSKKPIDIAEAISGEASSQADEKGEIILTLPQSDSETVEVKINADGYRSESVKLVLSSKQTQQVNLVPSRKQAFISKRGGTYDLYKIDVDGKNEQKILAGTGSERSEAIALAAHPAKNIAALVSNREPGKNGKPSPSTLTIINLDDNSTVSATTSERIQPVDWLGDKLIYVKVADGEPEASQTRHRLMSYDITAKSERELASTNYFNDVTIANGAVYYSPASYQINGAVGLYKINADGNYRKSVYDKEAWNLFRTDYNKLSVSNGQEWFDLDLTTDAITKANGPPTVPKSRNYLDSSDSKTSLWIDERDGKGVLLNYDKEAKKDTAIHSQSGLKNPVRWLDSTHVVYRISNTSEIADYVINTEGGEPRKIRDVTDTAGVDRWYYY